jgi:hypothetical protein
LRWCETLHSGDSIQSISVLGMVGKRMRCVERLKTRGGVRKKSEKRIKLGEKVGFEAGNK